MRKYYIYIMTNNSNSVLYIGMTNNLSRRVIEHKTNMREGFTKKYNLHKLVYYEEYQYVYEAIIREKHLKGWLRKRKIALINKLNPEWNDLGRGFNHLIKKV